MRLLLACGLCFALTGCTEETTRTTSAPSSDTTAFSDQTQTRTDSLQHYSSPDAFPLSFTTTLPAGWRVQQVDRSVGKTIRFYRDSGPQPSALELHLYQPGATKQGITKRVRDKAASMGAVSEQTPDYDWAFASYSFEGKRLAGTIWGGERDSLFFYVMTSHPPGADSRFTRQARTVLDRWQWQDHPPSS